MSEKFANRYRIDSARLKNWDYRSHAAYFITICTTHREHFFGEVKDGKMVLSNTGVIADICWHEIPNHAPLVKLGEFVVMPNHIHGILILENPDETGDNGDVETNDGVTGGTINAGSGGDVAIVDEKNGESVDAKFVGNVDGGFVGNVDGGFVGNVDGGFVETLHATSLPQPQQPQPQQPQQPRENQPQPPQSPENMEYPETPHSPNHQWMGDISPKSNSISTIVRSYKSAVTKHANRLGLEHGWQTRFYDHVIRNGSEYQRIANYINNNPAQWHGDQFHTNHE